MAPLSARGVRQQWVQTSRGAIDGGVYECKGTDEGGGISHVRTDTRGKLAAAMAATAAVVAKTIAAATIDDLHEHMICAGLPDVTQRLNGGKYVACRSCTGTTALEPKRLVSTE